MTTSAPFARSSGGRLFRLAATSGLITGVSANGVIFAWRNPSTDKPQHLAYLKAKWRTVAGFTAAQEMALALHLVSSFDGANYTGGTDLSDPASSPAYVRPDAGFGASLTQNRIESVLVSGNVRIADTGALSHGGSPVIQSQPFLWESFAELAAAATVHKGHADLVYDPQVQGELVLATSGGFIIRPPIALGAGGTGRLSVEVGWYER